MKTWTDRAIAACMTEIELMGRLQTEAYRCCAAYEASGDKRGFDRSFKLQCEFANDRALAEGLIHKLANRTKRRAEAAAWNALKAA